MNNCQHLLLTMPDASTDPHQKAENSLSYIAAYLPLRATTISHKPPVKKIKSQSKPVILLENPRDELDDEADAATLITLPPEFDLFASSAALKVTSRISPQCLHFFASFFTSSEQ